MYEKKMISDNQLFIEKKIDDYKFVSRKNRRLQIVITKKLQQFRHSKRDDFCFVLKKKRRLQMINNEKQSFKKNRFCRNHDRSKSKS